MSLNGDTLGNRILYGDSNCVVVNKIAGEAVESAGKGMIDLPRILAVELSALNYPPVTEALPLPVAVHRIDVPVSGCVVFARTEAALRFLNAAFQERTTQKNYWAIIETPPGIELFLQNTAENTELVHWIQFDSKKNKSIAHNESGSGRKKAVLYYRLAGRGENYLFLEIDLITGRHHQIRAQLEKQGLHIKGDLKYGAKRSEPHGGIRLHARSISFPDPSDNSKRITVHADPPLRDNLWLAFMNIR